MALKILHSADWQLGKAFTRFGDGDLPALLREARLAVVERLAAIAAENEVAAVLVAGDVLESEHAEPALLRRMVHRMAGYRGPWLLLPGNHDPARAGGIWERFEKSGDCPANVRVLSEPRPVPLEDGQLLVLPAPLTQKHVAGDPTAWFDSADLPAGALKVGLGHGPAAGILPEQAASANPIARDRAERSGLDYLALGDWHSILQVGPRTWYSGTPEPDDFTRTGLGEALLVTLDGPGAPPRIERQRTGRHIWRHERLDIGVAPNPAAIEDQLEALVGKLERPGETVLRLAVEGLVDLATGGAVEAMLDRLAARLRHLDSRLDDLRVEPSETDLAAFAGEPLLAEVAAALERSTDESAPLALRLLHNIWQRLGHA